MNALTDNSVIRDDNAVNVDDNRLTDNVIKPAVILVKQGLQQNDDIRPTDIVRMREIKPKTAFCEYSECGKEFVQTVSWKRFCCDDCRKLNWELKYGKKLNLK